MLSSCKNTAWEKSKCLHHPQLPSPALPRLELGPGWETPVRPPRVPGPLALTGRGDCCRNGVREAAGPRKRAAGNL